jgi:hypothetical protein
MDNVKITVYAGEHKHHYVYSAPTPKPGQKVNWTIIEKHAIIGSSLTVTIKTTGEVQEFFNFPFIVTQKP